MTTAKITRPGGYDCAPTGARIETFPLGAIVHGQVAEWALQDKAASAMFSPVEETKVVTPPETKKRGRPRKDAQ